MMNLPTTQGLPWIRAPSPYYDEKRKDHRIWYGYRAAAQYMASDNDFFVVRRFAAANTRVLLAKQAEIFDLERRLDDLDHPKLGENPPMDNSTVLNDRRIGRPALLNDLFRVLKEYSAFTH